MNSKNIYLHFPIVKVYLYNSNSSNNSIICQLYNLGVFSNQLHSVGFMSKRFLQQIICTHAATIDFNYLWPFIQQPCGIIMVLNKGI